MKKIWKTITNRVKNIVGRAKTAATRAICATQLKLAEENGQFVMDNAMVFVIIVVAAGIVIGLFTAFLNTDLAPALKTKILGFL